jgi:hypothetical protein
MSTVRTAQSIWRVRLGRVEPRHPARVVRIGRLTAALEDADLLDVRFRDTELVRRIAVRVRDTSWGTLPAEVQSSAAVRDRDELHVRLDVCHRDRNIDFGWRGTIAPDGRQALIYEMEGRAQSNFLYNRIGLCVLHPPALSAGRPYRAWTSDGPVSAGFLPLLIGPQMIVDGRVFSLFPAFSRLEIDVTSALTLVFEFEGDLFEMEDQRNYGDGSFKTYSTPLSLPLPFQARKGQQFHQRVRVEVRENKDLAPRRQLRRTIRSAAELSLTGPIGARMPPVGLCLDFDCHVPDEREVRLLRALAPSYLRVDVLLAGGRARGQLAHAALVATALDTPLELALTFTSKRRASREALERLRSDLERLRCIRFFVFHANELVTSPNWLALVRSVLSTSLNQIPVVGGTNLNFAELNRSRPDLTTLDGVAFSITPQVHDSDEAALVQSLEGQRDTVRTAHSFMGRLPVHIGAITFKPRLNPNAAALNSGAEYVPGEADERQPSLFAAAWTAMSAKYLAEAGAASLTFFELTGQRGTVERTCEQQLAGRSEAIFPLYHVLRNLNAWRGAEIVGCSSSRPLAVEAFAAHQGDTLQVLVANLTPRVQRAVLTGLTSTATDVSLLDETMIGLASNDPDGFAAAGQSATVINGCLTLKLRPYAVARIANRIA